AVWIPPGGTELSEQQEPELERLLAEVFEPAAAERVRAVGEVLDDHHPHDEPHWYLTLLGTDPAHWGRGLGLKLLADTLQVVDADHLPAYLEASNEANVALYARYGFEPRDRVLVPGDGPDVVTMWRPAR
ncbi:MAG: GNAT family N-acetyltransferase, partial [Dermatophilaceae bacterium]